MGEGVFFFFSSPPGRREAKDVRLHPRACVRSRGVVLPGQARVHVPILPHLIVLAVIAVVLHLVPQICVYRERSLRSLLQALWIRHFSVFFFFSRRTPDPHRTQARGSGRIDGVCRVRTSISISNDINAYADAF